MHQYGHQQACEENADEADQDGQQSSDYTCNDDTSTSQPSAVNKFAAYRSQRRVKLQAQAPAVQTPKYKHQISNKFQYSISNNVLDLTHCILRFIWNLSFVIWHLIDLLPWLPRSVPSAWLLYILPGHYCNARGAATAALLLSLPLVPVMTRTEVVVPTRSLTPAGSLSRSM